MSQRNEARKKYLQATTRATREIYEMKEQKPTGNVEKENMDK
jgi:hypothetical protein